MPPIGVIVARAIRGSSSVRDWVEGGDQGFSLLGLSHGGNLYAQKLPP